MLTIYAPQTSNIASLQNFFDLSSKKKKNNLADKTDVLLKIQEKTEYIIINGPKNVSC